MGFSPKNVSSSAGCLTASRALNAAVRVGLAMTAVSAGSMLVAGFAPIRARRLKYYQHPELAERAANADTLG